MPHMIRDIDQLTGRTFDVLVVGGGIHGLAIAYDAAQRGLTVALVERSDFGSGSSFNHLRTIHGGLRYLQSLDLARARESIRERRTLARIAPHAVRPMPFAVPVYRSLVHNKWTMRAGFLVDRLVAAGRNRGVAASHRLRGGRVLGRGTAIQQFPGLRRQRLTGAAVYYDYVTTEADRLTFSYAIAAAEHGAVLANYVEAVAVVVENGRVAGVTTRDVLGTGDATISARVTVNATGARVDRLLQPLGVVTAIPMLKAMNLVTRRDAGDEALAGRSVMGRYLFLVPWRERALFGTWESDTPCDPDDTSVAERDVASFIAELNQAFPALDLTLNDVTLVHRGVVPAKVKGGHAMLEGHEQVRDHAAQGVDGIVTVAGTKFTTARGVAERVTNLLMSKLKRPAVACRTASTPLPGGSVRDVGLAIADARREHDEGLPSDTIPHLIAAYGSRYRDVMDLAADRPDWRKRVAPASPVIGAELILAARKEMAPTLADIVIRRTPLGALGYPGDEVLLRAAAIVGTDLRWSEARRQEEIAAVRSFYGCLAVARTL
ncbi:MAG TPA: glycerol-3-phosphate dehydrogenase/oxidase [Vicinamibacterales bacterium]|nr:glycerol-3-phosphate dehydrogenase/oxidase [Vicinamibacterales bacterium]